MTRRVGFSLMLVTGVLLAAQGGVRAVAPQQAAPASQQPSFKSGTILVQVDAIVTDKSRAFVADLGPHDFEVFEDGVPQQVEQIYLALEPGTKTAAVPLPAEGARPSAVVERAVSAPPATDTRRTFVLLFDTDDIQAGGFSRARDAALRFLKENFRAGDIGGVVTHGTMVNNRLTQDPSELEAALKGLVPTDASRSLQTELREWPRLLNAWEVYQIAAKNDPNAIQVAMARACADDADACRRGTEPPVEAKAARLLPDFRNRGLNAMRTVSALVGGLKKLPGRKTIILFTDGFIAEDEWANLRQITDEANRASVRIYSLDTRGLNRGSASSDIFSMGPHASVNPAGDPPGSVTGIDIGVDGPNSLAADTGGYAIRNENDFARALREVAIDTSSYYVLGYRTTNPKLDGKFRSIDVRVKRKGLTVRARKGYLATPDLAAAPAALPTVDRAAEPRPAAPANAPPPPVAPAAAATAPSTATQPNGAAAVGAAAVDPSAAVRLRPDVKDRLNALEKTASSRGTAAGSDGSRDTMARARAGWDAYQRGDMRAASASLSAAAQDRSAPPWVHYALGWTQFALSNYAPAAASWETVRARVPEFEPVYFDLADGYLQLQDYGKALEVLREAEKRWPKDVEVYNAIGVVQTGRYAFADAIKTFEKAVTVKGDDATAHYNLARVCELRYVQAQRIKEVSKSSAGGFASDKDCAVQHYGRTVEIGGLFVEEAKAGLKRLGQ